MNEPIAITGFGMRFPGGIFDEQSFWDFINTGKISVSEIPNDRWDVNRFYDPNPDLPGKMYVKHGNFLQQGVGEFDALHFGVTPREADCMDPQQRLLLTVVWEALHHAGIIPESLVGSRTGVYIGAFTLDNLIHQMGPQARDLINAHTAVGSTMTILSNRISYLLDLRGPSLSIDTACSSSLVALHHACEAIWSGQCELALVGGVNVMFRPEYFIAMCKGKFLAKDGRCKTFDARADGYGRAEGGGALVLKPLEKARADGDVIHGVISATGINQDGRSNGITSPNRDSQIDLIRSVHSNAEISPDEIGFIEAHGTGTQAGDTAESFALGEALGKVRKSPLPVGSVKANLGHLEAASGIAGVLKAMLCLKNRQVTPIAGLETVNADIPFDELGLHLPRESEDLTCATDKPYAAINSFGYGGTNAHVVLQRPSEDEALTESVNEDSGSMGYLLPLSCKDKTALSQSSKLILDFIAKTDEIALRDIEYSAACHRSHMSHRAVFFGKNRNELLQQLDAFSQGEVGALTRYCECDGEDSGVVFVFTGMGPQWWAMARELYFSEPVFQHEVNRCAQAFETVSGWSILDELLAPEQDSKMSQTVIAQPTNFIVQAGLTALWRARGITPSAIVGHSVGEVTAAFVSGVLTLEEAVTVSYFRSQVQSRAAGQGGMLAIGLTESATQNLLQQYLGAKVDIAAINGPASVTLAGDSDVLSEIASALEEAGEFNRKLEVEVPYHSPYMDPLMPALKDALAGLKPREPQLPLYSTVYGELVDGVSFDADYWVQNCRQAVRFAPAFMKLLSAGHHVFLELGPHPVLSTSMQQCAAEAKTKIHCITSLHRKQSDIYSIAMATAELHNLGCHLDWQKVCSPQSRYLPLPAYPWQANHHWLENRASTVDRLSGVEHPLLGTALESPLSEWQVSLGTSIQPWLPEHQVEDLTVLPGAAYVEMGLAAHRTRYGGSTSSLQNLRFSNALIVGATEVPHVQTRLDKDGINFSVFSRRDGDSDWALHAEGRLSSLIPTTVAPLDLELLRTNMTVKQNRQQHYDNMNARKLNYGRSFQGVTQLWRNSESVIADIDAPVTVKDELTSYHLHPALLDACFQSLLSILGEDDDRAFVPTQIDTLYLYQALPESFCCYGVVDTLSNEQLVGNLTLCTKQGDVIAELRGIQAKALSHSAELSAQELDKWLYQYEWLDIDLPATECIPHSDPVVLIGNIKREKSLANSLYTELSKIGQPLVTINYGESLITSPLQGYQIRLGNSDDMRWVCGVIAEQPVADVIVVPPDQTGNLVSVDSTSAVLAIVQGIARAETANIKRMSCITHCAQPIQRQAIKLEQSGCVGLFRVAANEYPRIQFRIIDVDDASLRDGPQQHVIPELLNNNSENEVAWVNHARKCFRLQRTTADALEATADARAGSRKRFSIDIGERIELRELDTSALEKSEVALSLTASTLLSNKIHQKTTGLPGQFNYGANLSLHLGYAELPSEESSELGRQMIVVDFERGKLASHIGACLEHSWKIPDALTVAPERLADVLLFTCAEVILKASNLVAEETVLVHAIDSGMGAALAMLATQRGARVYATAEDPERIIPALKAQSIELYDAHSDEFVYRLNKSLEGGVDLALNPYSGEVASRTVASVRSSGRMLDFSSDTLMCKPGILLQSLDINTLVKRDVGEFFHIMLTVVERLNRDQLPVLNDKLVKLSDAQEMLSAEKQLAMPAVLLPEPISDQHWFYASPVSIDAEATYLITGGFGGFGQGVIEDLVNRGAQHLVIVSRSGPKTSEDHNFLAELKRRGVNVICAKCDISDLVQVEALFADVIAKLPPLKGIAHTAGILDDSPINFVTAEQLDRVMRPKVCGAWNLHEYSRAASLDFFLLFSSISSMIGAAGQATYVIANTWLDTFASYRRQLGLPATAVCWGALDEVGMAAIDPEVVAYFSRVGLKPMPPRKVFACFESIYNWRTDNIGLVDMDWGAWASYYPSWGKSPRYAHLVPAKDSAELSSGDWLKHWASLSSDEQIVEIQQKLISLVAKSMKLPADKISSSDNLPSLGIDSLIAMELQLTIQETLQVRVSTLELMKGSSLQQLSEQIGKLCHETLSCDTPSVKSETDIELLDDAELDDLLATLTD